MKVELLKWISKWRTETNLPSSIKCSYSAHRWSN